MSNWIRNTLCVLAGILIVLLAFKLTGLVSWSWWRVTAPLWIPAIVVGVVGTVTAAILYIHENKSE